MVLFFLRNISPHINTCITLAKRNSTSGPNWTVCLSPILFGSLVCVICNSKYFHLFIFKLRTMIVHTLKSCSTSLLFIFHEYFLNCWYVDRARIFFWDLLVLWGKWSKFSLVLTQVELVLKSDILKRDKTHKFSNLFTISFR